MAENMTTVDLELEDLQLATFYPSFKFHRAFKALTFVAAVVTCAFILHHACNPAVSPDWGPQVTENTDMTNTTQILGRSSERGPYALSQHFIDRVNEKALYWKAGKNFPSTTSPERLRKLLGGRRLPRPLVNLPVKTLPPSSHEVPDHFDAREQWPNCRSVKEIRNQGCCGSCWAFSAVEVMSDRQCIIAGSEFRYSAQDPVSCSGAWAIGCDGGTPDDAFHMWQKHGIVSGGSFNSSEGCLPYLISECSPDNHGQVDDTPKCDPSCRAGYNLTYEEDKHFASETYRLFSEKDMLRELSERGPMTSRFSVYEDFYSYKEGVYHHVEGNFQGDHVVKVIGYGVENGLPYYLCANSWGYEWGDGGFFKIARKALDPYMSTGIPRLN